MSNNRKSAPGEFVWFELLTTDMKAAESFYSKVIGWQAKDSGMPGVSYTIFSTPRAQVGGVMEFPEKDKSIHPSWTGYLSVDDVDASTELVKQAGGILHSAPQDIPSVGRLSIVADLHGAVFALFKGDGDPQPPTTEGELGRVGWHELFSADAEKAFEFYSKQFGWKQTGALDMGPGGIYIMFATVAGPIGGILTKGPKVPGPHRWLYYFNVDSTMKAVERIRDAGGTIVMEPQEVPGGSWIAQALDPQGVSFAVVGPKG